MKPLSLCILITFTLTGKGIVYGQSKNQPVSFPTYNQIKPAATEVFDYVPQQTGKDVNRQNVVFKLFGYPDGTVTYIINGKSTTNAKYVKKVLNQDENQINSISIGEPAADGRRVIQLFFIPDKKD